MEFTMKHGAWTRTQMEISRRSVGDIANDDLVSGFIDLFIFQWRAFFSDGLKPPTRVRIITVYILYSNDNGQNWRFWRIRTLDISTYFEHMFGWTREMTMRFSQRPPCFFRRPDHEDSNVPREGRRSHPLSLRRPSRRETQKNRQSSTWKIRQIVWSWFVSISMSFWSSSSPA